MEGSHIKLKSLIASRAVTGVRCHDRGIGRGGMAGAGGGGGGGLDLQGASTVKLSDAALKLRGADEDLDVRGALQQPVAEEEGGRRVSG